MENRAVLAGLRDYSRAIALPTGRRKPSRYAVSAQFLGRNAAWAAIPATTCQVTNRSQIRAPGMPGPVSRQVKVAIVARRSLFEALIELPETLLSLLSGLRILAAVVANHRDMK